MILRMVGSWRVGVKKIFSQFKKVDKRFWRERVDEVGKKCNEII